MKGKKEPECTVPLFAIELHDIPLSFHFPENDKKFISVTKHYEIPYGTIIVFSKITVKSIFYD